MPLTAMIDEMVILLQGVSGIGKVLGYYSHVETEREIIDTYKQDGIIHAWIVTREATGSEDLGPRHRRDRHQIVIRGFRSVEKHVDGEQRHQELVEAVRAIFDPQGARHLPNLAGFIRTPLQVEQFGTAVFAKAFLCWYAQLSCEVEEERIGS